MAGYALPTTGLATEPDTGPPATAGEVWDAAFKAQRDIANPLARQRVLDEEYERRIRDVENATGIRLFHPRRDAPTVDDFRELQDDPDTWRGSASFGAAVSVAERRFHRELAKLAEQHPDKLMWLRPDVTVWDDAYARVRLAETSSEAAIRRSPLSVDVPLLGPLDPVALGASFWGWAHDPVNIATSVIGPGGSAAKGILWNASRQAVAGAMQQAAVEPFAQAWRREAGLDFGWQQAAQNVAFAGVFGAGLDAAGRSLSRAVRGVPQGGVPEPVPRPANDLGPELTGKTEAGEAAPAVAPSEPRSFPAGAGLDEALEAAARRLPEDHPVRRAAEGDAAATVELAERLGPLSDDPAAVRGALDRFKLETLQEASIAEALAAADVEERLAAHLRHVAEPEANPPGGPPIAAKPPKIVDYFDPQTSERLSSSEVEHIVSMWEYVRDTKKATPPQSLTQFLIARGGISDAHSEVRHVIGEARQRPGLVNSRGMDLDDATLAAWENGFLGGGERPTIATLLDQIAEDVRGNRVVRNIDATAAEDLRIARELEQELDQLGIVKARTADEVRAFFARQGDGGAEGGAASTLETLREGLREGFLDPVEAASLIRERPELAAEVPPTTDTARGIHALSRLSDPAFARVADGSMAPELAAIVADAAPPTLHADMIERLAAAAPRDADEARRLVAQMLQRPTDPATAALILRGADAGDGPPQRLRAPEFDEPAGDGAKLQTDSLKSLEDRATAFDDVKAKLRLFGKSKRPLMRLRDGGDLGGTAHTARFQAADAGIRAELAEAARATLPRGVQLEVSQRLAIGAYELDGYFDRRNNILAVALDAADPAFTFSHERIHALHAHGLFTDREWGLLVREAQKRGVRQEMGLDAVQAYRAQLMPSMVKEMLGRRGITDAAQLQWAELEPMLRAAKLIQGDDVRGSLERHGLWDEARLQAMIDEEAVARLAEGWRAGEPLPAGVAGLMQRVMAFLERLRNVLAGHGFHTLDDIFERIDTGEVAGRSEPPAVRADIEAATADADAGALVQACKLF